MTTRKIRFRLGQIHFLWISLTFFATCSPLTPKGITSSAKEVGPTYKWTTYIYGFFVEIHHGQRNDLYLLWKSQRRLKHCCTKLKYCNYRGCLLVVSIDFVIHCLTFGITFCLVSFNKFPIDFHKVDLITAYYRLVLKYIIPLVMIEIYPYFPLTNCGVLSLRFFLILLLLTLASIVLRFQFGQSLNYTSVLRCCCGWFILT